MGRKCNTKHPERGKSRYGERLIRRGLTKAPALEDLETLRKRQEKRIMATCSKNHEHDTLHCDGSPWYSGQRPATEDAA